jgi:hypothetical protein
MPKLRAADVADIDPDELENAEYSEGSYTSYSGDIAPADTVLRAYVKNIWWTRANPKPGEEVGSPMLKVLVIADGNEGELEEYDGMPMWENMVLTSAAKFKWHPFFEHFGISIRDVKANKAGKSNVVVSAEEDDRGQSVVEKIGSFVPGEDSDEAWCRVVTTREKYEGNWQAHVGVWLDYDEDEEGEEPEEPEEPEEEEPEEEPEEEDEPEEEPEEVQPARGRRTAAKASRTAPATPARSTARKPAPSRSAPAKGRAPAPAKRGRGRSAAGSSDDPPF